MPDWQSFDLDHEIAGSLQIKPDDLGDWIRLQGIGAFRIKEREELSRLLNLPGNKLIALGGGTLEGEGIMKLIKSSSSKLVYLNVPLKTCLLRTKGDTNRPLRSQSEEDLKKLHSERESRYRQADLILCEEDILGIDALSTLMHNL